MRILILNTFTKGGAAKAAIRLHQGLLHSNINSTIKFKNKIKEVEESEGSEEQILLNSYRERILFKIRRFTTMIGISKPRRYDKSYQEKFIGKRTEGLEWFSYPFSMFDVTTSDSYRDAEIINLHWVSELLDWPTFFEKNRKPIVWTLHDENPFSGGEHFSEQFLEMDELGCPIPRKNEKSEINEHDRIIRLKKKFLANIKDSDIHIVAPSKWLLSESQNSELFNRFKHTFIPNGFDTNVFKIRDQIKAREELKLPGNKLLILFVADYVSNSRKGFSYLKKALDDLDTELRERLTLCAIGNSDNINDKGIIQLGYIESEEEMAKLYSSADLFVIPSLEDNLPNTMIEALLCGTPVVGFPTGGIRETITGGVNGYLAESICSHDLKIAIEKFIFNRSNFDRDLISKNAQELYSLQKQAESYKILFEKIIRQRK